MKVLFFGQLREQLETDELVIDDPPDNVAKLRSRLGEKNQTWRELLADKSVLVAVNQTISNSAAPLNSDDEVAFFPPVTGG